MNQVQCTFTVFFEEPFWVGIYQRKVGTSLQLAKVIFGSEPKDYTVLEYLLRNWKQLSFSPPVKAVSSAPTAKNPKRLQRQIQKSLHTPSIGTKSQQAFQLQREQNKSQRKQRRTAFRNAHKEQLFLMHQQKKKQKHRGR